MNMKEFILNGLKGTAELISDTPNKYGNLCAEIKCGDLVARPTFRSEQDFEKFISGEHNIEGLLDEAAHNS